MKRTAIGKTGLEVTSVGFGTSALGSMPDTYGYAVEEERASATLKRIFAGPSNLIDTSRNYGMGRSEERIGAALREIGGLPEGFVLSTKLDRDMDTNGFDAARARRSFEESLEALGVDRVQILHLHDPEHVSDLSEVTRKGGALDELVKIKEEGLADAIGLAMGTVELMTRLLPDWPFDAMINHNRFTLLNREADALFDMAHERGIAILNAAPFAGGVLAKGSAEMPRVTYMEADEGALAPVRAVEAVCARHGVRMVDAAFRFPLCHPAVVSVIPGGQGVAEMESNLRAAATEIPPALWSDLKAEGLMRADAPVEG